MGEVSMNPGGLLSSIASLFDKRLFSDIEFIFTTDNNVSGRIFCHSLILAVRSKVFASMFYEDLNKKPFHQVKLPSSKASSFSQLVRFLYTDDLQLHTFEEAVELYDLAKEYAVEELIQKCSNFILKEKLDNNNIFSKYEYALSKDIHTLLKECQNFVCFNSQQVLQSDDFTKASINVVEDVVKLDNLSVSTELEIIGAVLRWGSEELKHKNLPLDEKNLRKCIDPFKKHLRFLTLKREEFDYLIDRYDIFSSKESSKLTQKIINPSCDVVLPDSLCSIDIERSGKVSFKSEPSVSLRKNSSSHLYANKTIPPNDVTSFDFNQNSFGSESLFKNVDNKAFDGFSTKNTPSASLSNNSYDKLLKRSTSDIFSNFPSSPIFSLHEISKSLTPNTTSDASNIPKFLSPEAKNVSYEIKKKSPFDETVKKRNSAEGVSSPLSARDSLYLAPTMMNGCSRHRDFEFSLRESSQSFRTSFQNDVKSTIYFEMITGNMHLHGFEIKVESKSNQTVEELAVDVDLKGFSKQPFSELFQKQLKSDVICIEFNEKMVLQAGNKGVLDVSIENLLLNRCSTCTYNKPLKLNCGNNFSCKMAINSTQKTEIGFLFLVSKLMYVPF